MKFPSDLETLTGRGPYSGTYKYAGVVELLPADRVGAEERLDYLKSVLWLDAATRAISINFNVYHKVNKLLTAARVTIEITEAGIAYPRPEFITFPTRVYELKTTTVARVISEAVFIVSPLLGVTHNGCNYNKIIASMVRRNYIFCCASFVPN